MGGWGSHANHKREMSAGRFPGDNNTLGIDVVFGCIRIEPLGCLEHIVHGRGSCGDAAQAEFYVRNNKALLKIWQAEARDVAFLRLPNPATAVNNQYSRTNF